LCRVASRSITTVAIAVSPWQGSSGCLSDINGLLVNQGSSGQVENVIYAYLGKRSPN